MAQSPGHMNKKKSNAELLLEAAVDDNFHVVLTLLKSPGSLAQICDPDNTVTPLIAAVKHENIEGVRTLLKAAQDQANFELIDHETADGHTALIWSAILNSTEIMRMLLDAGSSIDFETSLKKTALIVAAQFGECDPMELLIQRGAKVNYIAQDGNTALCAAVKTGYLPSVKLLLRSGANVFQEYRGLGNIVACAHKWGHDDIASYIERWLKGDENGAQEKDDRLKETFAEREARLRVEKEYRQKERILKQQLLAAQEALDQSRITHESKQRNLTESSGRPRSPFGRPLPSLRIPPNKSPVLQRPKSAVESRYMNPTAARERPMTANPGSPQQSRPRSTTPSRSGNGGSPMRTLPPVKTPTKAVPEEKKFELKPKAEPARRPQSSPMRQSQSPQRASSPATGLQVPTGQRDMRTSRSLPGATVPSTVLSTLTSGTTGSPTRRPPSAPTQTAKQLQINEDSNQTIPPKKTGPAGYRVVPPRFYSPSRLQKELDKAAKHLERQTFAKSSVIERSVIMSPDIRISGDEQSTPSVSSLAYGFSAPMVAQRPGTRLSSSMRFTAPVSRSGSRSRGLITTEEIENAMSQLGELKRIDTDDNYDTRLNTSLDSHISAPSEDKTTGLRRSGVLDAAMRLIAPESSLMEISGMEMFARSHTSRALQVMEMDREVKNLFRESDFVTAQEHSERLLALTYAEYGTTSQQAWAATRTAIIVSLNVIVRCAQDDVALAMELLDKCEYWTEAHSFGESVKTDRLTLRTHVLQIRAELLRRRGLIRQAADNCKRGLAIEAKLRLRDVPFLSRLTLALVFMDAKRNEEAARAAKDALIEFNGMVQYVQKLSEDRASFLMHCIICSYEVIAVASYNCNDIIQCMMNMQKACDLAQVQISHRPDLLESLQANLAIAQSLHAQQINAPSPLSMQQQQLELFEKGSFLAAPSRSMRRRAPSPSRSQPSPPVSQSQSFHSKVSLAANPYEDDHRTPLAKERLRALDRVRARSPTH